MLNKQHNFKKVLQILLIKEKILILILLSFFIHFYEIKTSNASNKFINPAFMPFLSVTEKIIKKLCDDKSPNYKKDNTICSQQDYKTGKSESEIVSFVFSDIYRYLEPEQKRELNKFKSEKEFRDKYLPKRSPKSSKTKQINIPVPFPMFHLPSQITTTNGIGNFPNQTASSEKPDKKRKIKSTLIAPGINKKDSQILPPDVPLKTETNSAPVIQDKNGTSQSQSKDSLQTPESINPKSESDGSQPLEKPEIVSIKKPDDHEKDSSLKKLSAEFSTVPPAPKRVFPVKNDENSKKQSNVEDSKPTTSQKFPENPLSSTQEVKKESHVSDQSSKKSAESSDDKTQPAAKPHLSTQNIEPENKDKSSEGLPPLALDNLAKTKSSVGKTFRFISQKRRTVTRGSLRQIRSGNVAILRSKFNPKTSDDRKDLANQNLPSHEHIDELKKNFIPTPPDDLNLLLRKKNTNDPISFSQTAGDGLNPIQNNSNQPKLTAIHEYINFSKTTYNDLTLSSKPKWSFTDEIQKKLVNHEKNATLEALIVTDPTILKKGDLKKLTSTQEYTHKYYECIKKNSTNNCLDNYHQLIDHSLNDSNNDFLKSIKAYKDAPNKEIQSSSAAYCNMANEYHKQVLSISNQDSKVKKIENAAHEMKKTCDDLNKKINDKDENAFTILYADLVSKHADLLKAYSEYAANLSLLDDEDEFFDCAENTDCEKGPTDKQESTDLTLKNIITTPVCSQNSNGTNPLDPQLTKPLEIVGQAIKTPNASEEKK